MLVNGSDELALSIGTWRERRFGVFLTSHSTPVNFFLPGKIRNSFTTFDLLHKPDKPFMLCPWVGLESILTRKAADYKGVAAMKDLFREENGVV